MLNCRARQENNVILNEKYKTNLFKTKMNKLIKHNLLFKYFITLIVGQAAGWIHSTIHFV